MYEFHPDALVELEQTAHYYGAREAGLDIRFIDSVEETVGRILEAPTRWRIIEDDVRRCLTHVFPHGILYVRGSFISGKYPCDVRLKPRAQSALGFSIDRQCDSRLHESYKDRAGRPASRSRADVHFRRVCRWRCATGRKVRRPAV